jgi:outer membrane protein TolC
MQIKSDTINAFKRLKEVAETLYRSGKTSFQDVVKININIEILNEDLVTLTGQRQNIAIRLLELLNLPRQTRVGQVVAAPVPERPMTAEQLYPLAEKYRPELRVIHHGIRRLENMIELSESMIQGPSTLGFSTFNDTFPTKTMAAMANNSPIKPWYGVEDPWLNQTRQTLLSLRQTLVQEENATIRMVRQAWFDLDRAHRELHLYSQRILPLSKSALDVSTGEYESGSIPFSQAIDAYTTWLGVKLAIAQRQTDIGIYTAILEKIVGKTSD